jgi:glycerol-3-phosphate dehydrogenase
MNISLIMTAVQLGAVVANHVEVTALHKNKDEKLCGARVKDNMTGEEWDVQAKVKFNFYYYVSQVVQLSLCQKGIVNATGPFTDALLRLDALSTSSSSITPSLPIPKPTVAPSSGVHITLPNYYSPRTMGLLDPATSDGRVIFFLPWQGNTIAGTTDTQCDVERDPLPKEEEIRWILEEVRRCVFHFPTLSAPSQLNFYFPKKRYLSPDIKVRRGDVLSAWSGLRPLIRDPNSSNSKDLVRSHIVTVSPSGLLTIAGGKWTTYRRMAEEAVDEAFKVFPGLKREGVSETCRTERVRLVGSEEWSKTMFIRLIQRVSFYIFPLLL